MQKMIIVMAAVILACAAQPPAAPPRPDPAGVTTLGYFTGEIDLEARTVSFRSAPPPSASGGAPLATIFTEGSSTFTISNASIPVATTDCGSQPVLQVAIRLTNHQGTRYAPGALYLELTSMSATGAEGCNSDPAPTGLSGSLGLWSYGTLTNGSPTADRTWNLKLPTGQKVTFAGRVVGVMAAEQTFVAPHSSSPWPFATFLRDHMVYAQTGTARLQRFELNGALRGSAITVPAEVTTVAASLGSSSADDLVWFTTTNVSNLSHVGVLKSTDVPISVQVTTGAAPSLFNIVADPTNHARAWFVRRTSDGAGSAINSVTVDLGRSSVALGSEFPGSANSQIAFGPSNLLYVSDNTAIRAYDVSSGSLVLAGGPYTPPAACSAPYVLLQGPDGKIWFTRAEGGVCNMTAAGSFTYVGAGSVSGGLVVAKAVFGSGDSVWAMKDGVVTEYVEGAPAFFSIAIPGGVGMSMGSHPAASGQPAYIWAACTKLERVQPQ
jgi:hypothetical protein